jgi:hypothetical protein
MFRVFLNDEIEPLTAQFRVPDRSCGSGYEVKKDSNIRHRVDAVRRPSLTLSSKNETVVGWRCSCRLFCWSYGQNSLTRVDASFFSAGELGMWGR